MISLQMIWKVELLSDVRVFLNYEILKTGVVSGVWEVPLNDHYVQDFEGGHCPYLDQCVLHNHDANEVFGWLQEDFLRYYEQNKAPYMMSFHTNWFSIKELEQGLHKFVEWTTTL